MTGSLRPGWASSAATPTTAARLDPPRRGAARRPAVRRARQRPRAGHRASTLERRLAALAALETGRGSRRVAARRDARPARLRSTRPPAPAARRRALDGRPAAGVDRPARGRVVLVSDGEPPAVGSTRWPRPDGPHLLVRDRRPSAVGPFVVPGLHRLPALRRRPPRRARPAAGRWSSSRPPRRRGRGVRPGAARAGAGAGRCATSPRTSRASSPATWSATVTLGTDLPPERHDVAAAPALRLLLGRARPAERRLSGSPALAVELALHRAQVRRASSSSQ